jgi:tRNA (mo5U34)-methyltransferase
MKDTALQTEIERLKPWFHNLHLPGGLQTAPDHFLGDFPFFKWKELSPHIPEDLQGWKVLDIGCNAGFYTFQLAKRGARVVGIDLDEHYLKQARWAARIFGVEDQVEFRQQQVYDLAHVDERYDLVVFMGVLYHLRYPMLALDIVSQKVDKLMIFQTLMMPDKEIKAIKDDYHINDRKEMLEHGWPKMAFIEKHFAGDPTNWWAPNHAAVEAMLRTCGMEVLSKPLEETFICAPNKQLGADLNGWNRSEYLAAIGKPWLEEVGKKTGK